MTEAAPAISETWTAEWVLPVASPPLHQGFVRVEGGQIMAVGRLEDLPEAERPAPAPPGTLISPGLVNTHVHLEQTWPTPIPGNPDRPFSEWLLQVRARNGSAESQPQKAERCRLGLAELLATGTTCANDITAGIAGVEALVEAGLRGISAQEFFNPGPTVNVTEVVAFFGELLSRYAGHPRVQVGLSPHAPYNVSPPAWQAVLEAFPEAIIHTHIAETAAECQFVRGEGGDIDIIHQSILKRRFPVDTPAASPVAYLARFKLLTPGMILAHAVHTDETDRRMLAEAGAGIAHCPRSNLALHGQTLRFEDWAGTGVSLGLGTDGRLSTPDLDLRAEARTAMQLHGWNPATALAHLTYHGAAVMGLNHLIGTLEPGKQADLVRWQGEPGEATPEARLMHPATRVEQVMIAGRIRWPRP